MLRILDNPAIREMAMPMSVEQYHRLSESGIIPERTELLCGVIIDKMTRSPRHVYLARFLNQWLMQSVPEGFLVRKEEPLTLRDSEPEPDLAIVRGTDKEFELAHPTTAEFVIEVAITSLDLDREKCAVYAAAGVPEYWIVIPDERVIEVYTSPSPDGYQQTRRHEGVAAPLAVMVFPGLSLTPGELFG